MTDQIAILRGEQPDFGWTDEEAAFFSADERAKRCTGEQSRAIEGKVGLIELCLASRWPVKLIAQRAGVSDHVVTVIKRRMANEVATDSKSYARLLRGWSAEAFAVAMSRMGEAEPHTLFVGGGIMATHAREFDLMGAVGEEKIVKEERDELEVCAKIREMARQVRGPVDSASTREPLQVKALGESEAESARGGSHTAASAVLDLAAEPRANTSQDGRGGGSEAAGEASLPMPQLGEDLAVKASSASEGSK